MVATVGRGIAPALASVRFASTGASLRSEVGRCWERLATANPPAECCELTSRVRRIHQQVAEKPASFARFDGLRWKDPLA